MVQQMNETVIFTREDHPYFTCIYERSNWFSLLIGRRFRYVCYMYEPNKIRALTILRGYSRTEEKAKNVVTNSEDTWLHVWNEEKFWDQIT